MNILRAVSYISMPRALPEDRDDASLSRGVYNYFFNVSRKSHSAFS